MGGFYLSYTNSVYAQATGEGSQGMVYLEVFSRPFPTHSGSYMVNREEVGRALAGDKMVLQPKGNE
jgi:hypothetical protein